MNQSRKQALLSEFDQIIAPQKYQLAQVLPGLWKQCYEPPQAIASKPSAVAATPPAEQQPGATAAAVPVHAASTPYPSTSKGVAKRPPQSVPGIQNAKRPKFDDVNKRIDDIFKQCLQIVTKKLWGKKEANPFYKPVHPQRDNVPDYFNYIKHPMDLGTIKTKLQNKKYSSPLEFRDDVRLVWKNCATYNPTGHIVNSMGEKMSGVWEKAWAESNIEAQWNEIMYLQDPKGEGLPFKVNQLNSQLKAVVNSAPAADGQPDPNRPMSDLEKRNLSVQLGELQQEQLAGVLEILRADITGVNPDDEEEVELDIDALSNSTLWKLREYADGVFNRNKAPVKRAPEKRPQANGDAGNPASTAKPEEKSHSNANNSSSSSSGSDSEHDSPQEVKGSTMDDPNPQNERPFVRERQLVDESATNPKENPFVQGRGQRKGDAPIVNSALWNLEQPAKQEEENPQEPEDDLWRNFQTVDEQQKKKAEEQKQLKEQQEEVQRKKREQEEEEARRKAQEEGERQKALLEEEQREAMEQARKRKEQCEKEVDEIKAKAGTAALVQPTDVQALVNQLNTVGNPLEQAGLHFQEDDADCNFDDD